METTHEEQILSPDRPLNNPEEDIFGYDRFAENLARSLRRMTPVEGMVVAIHGPWGSGKSSVLNFVRHYLEKGSGQEERPDEERPLMMRFSPWWFSGREDLTRLFFGQLRARLGDKDYGELKSRLADLADIASKVPGLPGREAGEFIADKLRGEPDLDALKEKVDSVLRKKGRKIIVFIDDVDRLAPAEIRNLFRMIKAVASFPNVVYVLAFEREIVENALEAQEGTDSGRRYLEKIVQGSFDLPPVEQVDLRRMLFSRLDPIISGTQADLDEHYFSNVYFDGLEELLATPRDVTRLTNALRVTFPAVEGEVNPVDFVAIEAIRTFEPDIYRLIRESPNVLTGRPGDERRGRVFGNEEEARFDSWLDQVSEHNRGAVKGVLSRLFPKFAAEYGGNFYSPEFERKWSVQRRICSPDVFPVYFRLSVSTDRIAEEEMREWLSLADDPESFGQHLLEFTDQERRDGTTRARIAIDRLNDYAHEELQDEYVLPVIDAIFRVGSELLSSMEDSQGIWDFGADVRVGRVLVTLFRRLDEAERLDTLERVISEGGSASLAENLTVVIGQQHGEFGADPSPERERLLGEDELNQLKQIFVDRIRELADDDLLLDEPELWSILGLWRNLTDEDDEVREWVETAVGESDEALVRLLEVAKKVVRSQTMGSYSFTEQPRLDPQKLEPYLDPDEIIDRARDLVNEDDLSENQRTALQQFIEEYELREEGEDPDAYYRRPD
jgi:predicted KAP-like P-loop ATPase